MNDKFWGQAKNAVQAALAKGEPVAHEILDALMALGWAPPEEAEPTLPDRLRALNVELEQNALGRPEPLIEEAAVALEQNATLDIPHAATTDVLHTRAVSLYESILQACLMYPRLKVSAHHSAITGVYMAGLREGQEKS